MSATIGLVLCSCVVLTVIVYLAIKYDVTSLTGVLAPESFVNDDPVTMVWLSMFNRLPTAKEHFTTSNDLKTKSIENITASLSAASKVELLERQLNQLPSPESGAYARLAKANGFLQNNKMAPVKAPEGMQTKDSKGKLPRGSSLLKAVAHAEWKVSSFRKGEPFSLSPTDKYAAKYKQQLATLVDSTFKVGKASGTGEGFTGDPEVFIVGKSGVSEVKVGAPVSKSQFANAIDRLSTPTILSVNRGAMMDDSIKDKKFNGMATGGVILGDPMAKKVDDKEVEAFEYLFDSMAPAVASGENVRDVGVVKKTKRVEGFSNYSGTGAHVLVPGMINTGNTMTTIASSSSPSTSKTSAPSVAPVGMLIADSNAASIDRDKGLLGIYHKINSEGSGDPMKGGDMLSMGARGAIDDNYVYRDDAVALAAPAGPESSPVDEFAKANGVKTWYQYIHTFFDFSSVTPPPPLPTQTRVMAPRPEGEVKTVSVTVPSKESVPQVYLDLTVQEKTPVEESQMEAGRYMIDRNITGLTYACAQSLPSGELKSFVPLPTYQ